MANGTLTHGAPVMEHEFKAALTLLLSYRDLDCRRAGAARRVRTYARRLERDLGGDLSVQQQQLVARASMLAVLCEHTETSLLLGHPASIADYLAAVSVQKQLLAALGLRRVPRDITPTLDQYLDLQQQEAAE